MCVHVCVQADGHACVFLQVDCLCESVLVVLKWTLTFREGAYRTLKDKFAHTNKAKFGRVHSVSADSDCRPTSRATTVNYQTVTSVYTDIGEHVLT